MARFPAPPRRYREDHPKRGVSVTLGGHTLNLTELARGLKADHGYLSKVLSGRRTPSLPFAEKLAEALGWDLTSLMQAIRERHAGL